jgi:hypothetical protein
MGALKTSHFEEPQIRHFGLTGTPCRSKPDHVEFEPMREALATYVTGVGEKLRRFPFSDGPRVKRRPTLAISHRVAFNGPAGYMILAMITTGKAPKWPLDVTIQRR